MGSLISHTSMAVDGLCGVGDLVRRRRADHDTDDGTTLGLELIDVTGYDSGVVRQRYRPAT